MSVLSLEKAVPPTKKVSKALFSPKPIKQKSINESHESLLLASITFTQNKWNSLESISFDPLFLDKSKSLHFIPTFSCLDDFVEQDNRKCIKEEEEMKKSIDEMRKECSNPQYKDPFFTNFKDQIFKDDSFEIADL